MIDYASIIDSDVSEDNYQFETLGDYINECGLDGVREECLERVESGNLEGFELR